MDVSVIMTPLPLTVAPDADLDKTFQFMDSEDIRHLPVVEDGEVIGVVSDRDLATELGWLPAITDQQRAARKEAGGKHLVSEVMHRNVTTVASDDSVVTAAVDFVMQGIGCLPVVDNGKLVGIVTEIDMAMAYWSACKAGLLEGDVDPAVSKHMTADPKCVAMSTLVKEAIELIKKLGVRHLPVVDGPRLVGIVSDRDLRACYGEGRADTELIGSIMVPDPVVVREEETMGKVAEHMVSQRISSLPVVRGKHVVGIVTLADLIDHCIDTLREPETFENTP